MTLRAFLVLLALLIAAPAAAQEIPGLPKSGGDAPAAEAPATAPIALESPDPDIARRLAGIYSDIDDFQGVRASVRGGVVTLTGTTLTALDREKAASIAERLTGVIEVQNEITVEHRVDRRLEPLAEKARAVAEGTIAFIPLLAVAIAVFIGFWLIGSFLAKGTKLFRRRSPNPFVDALVRQVIRIVFALIGLVTAMSILGATAVLGSILGAAGLFGLAVGFAVRDTIENYIASILLSVRQPFAPGDHVIIEGFEGKITLLNARATVITTFDGNEVRIPNATVYKTSITNFSRIPERRFMFEVGVGYDADLTCALALALSTLKQVEGVLEDPAPFVLVDRMGDWSVVIRVFGWADQVKSDWGKVKSEAIRQVKAAFEEAGISIPEPIQNVRSLDLAPPAGPARPAAAPPAPSQEALREITDTGADHTIDDKVKELRAESREEDLMSKDGGPKE